MKSGDVVLFSLKNTGRFDYRGVVVGTVESPELGAAIWPSQPGLPWSLVYLLSDVRRLRVSKAALNSEFGYESGYRVPGIIRVNKDAVKRAMVRHGSLDALLAATSRESEKMESAD
jgi:hypothetical protein